MAFYADLAVPYFFGLEQGPQAQQGLLRFRHKAPVNPEKFLFIVDL
jgi:hypothetical protein